MSVLAMVKAGGGGAPAPASRVRLLDSSWIAKAELPKSTVLSDSWPLRMKYPMG